MTDLEELFRPLIDDSAAHREPVEAIEARGRERRNRRRRQRAVSRFGAAFVAVALIATAVGVVHARGNHGTARPARVETTTSPPSTVVTPTGWTTYDYGLARISIPAGWSTTTRCPQARTFVMVDPSTDGLGCGAGGSGPDLEIEPIPLDRAHEPYHPNRRVNGIAYEAVLPRCLTTNCPSLIAYVPDLEVAISFVGVDPTPMLDTLTLSTYARVLEQPFGSVPGSWIPVSYAGYEVSVPRSWPGFGPAGVHGFCHPAPNTVYLGVDDSPSCVALVGHIPQPEASVQLRVVPVDHSGAPTTLPSSTVLRHNGLRIIQTPVSGPFVTELAFVIDGPRGPVQLILGLGLDPAVARAILGSIKLAGS